MVEISFQEFQNLDIRIGKVVKVEEIPKSKHLYKLIVDFGAEQRQAIAGLKDYYSPQELEGKKFVFIVNLERRKIMGEESQCMILAAEDEAGNVVLLKPEKDIVEGSKVR
ncbi:MAG: methionine--tRNA ligase subunit beta [Candidatus Aenigmatarchaeota archaeon]